MNKMRKMKRPDYKGSRDEIVRLSIEARFTAKIKVKLHCQTDPCVKFRSTTEYWVECPVCKLKTKPFKHEYEAKQEWNWLIDEINNAG